jgi:hypothetical protein
MMFWYPEKAAFRAGYSNGLDWSFDSIGRYSAAFGTLTTASGSASFASGESTTASGFCSSASGFGTAALGSHSFASGLNTTAPSFAEVAIGINNTTYTPISTSSPANTDRVFVIGNGSFFSGTESDAFTVLKSGDIKIGNNGTFFTNLKEGRLSAGSQTGSNRKTVAITFPSGAFNNASNVRVVLTPKLANGLSDVFILSVRDITTTGCIVEIYRVDTPVGITGWGTPFDIQWMAWE